MDGRGEHVVGGLAHVDVVVGVNAGAGELGDDLVGVRVGGGTRAGLEDVDRELPVVAALGDLTGGALDARGGALSQQPELGVDGGGGPLDAPQPAHHRYGYGLAGDREVFDRLVGLRSPQLLLGRHSL
jgi:hypothetical protein